MQKVCQFKKNKKIKGLVEKDAEISALLSE